MPTANDPWSELDDLAVDEARMIVDLIKEATSRGEHVVELRGLITPASVAKLREKHYEVEQCMVEANPGKFQAYQVYQDGSGNEPCTRIYLKPRYLRREQKQPPTKK